MKIFRGAPGSIPDIFRQPARRSPDDASAERLLSGVGAGPDAPAGQRTLALVLEAAARPATARELSGEQAAVTAFLLAVGAPGRRQRTGDWGRTRARTGARSLRHTLVLAAIGCALVAAGVLGGAAAAGGLPAPLQKVAHTVFDAPAPRPAAPPSGGHGRTRLRTPGPGVPASGPHARPGIGARAMAVDRTIGYGRRWMAGPDRGGWHAPGDGQDPWHGQAPWHGRGHAGSGSGQGWRSARRPRAASSGTAGPTRS